MCLRYHTSTSLTPDQAHEIGLRQVAELTAEADPLLRARGPDPRQRRRADHRAAAGRSAISIRTPTPAAPQLLADLNRQMEAVRARMPEYFNTIPRSPMEVKRVPPAIEVGAPRGYAQGPSLDGSRPGAYLHQPARHPHLAEMGAADAHLSRERSRAISGRARSCSRTSRSRCSTAISASPLMARAGASMPSSSPTRSACTPISRRPDRHAAELPVPRRADRHGHRHARQGLEPRAVDPLFHREGRARPDLGDQRGRALRRLAGPGLQLQDRP